MKIPVVDSERAAEFLAGKAILVTNIHKLFNGKSVFGVGDEGIKINIGSLLIDDAHACLNTIREKYYIKLPSTHPAYSRIWPIIRESLSEQSSSKVLEIEAHDPVAQMRVPFWKWQKEADTIAKILYDYREDSELKFVWPLIKESIRLCQCNVGGGFLEISPTLLPIEMIPAFRAAKRRIYMSATISDETVFVADLQADENAIQNLIVPKTADDLGDRMILFPQAVNPKISDDELRDFFKEASKKYNVVVLVPSKKRAEFWAGKADLILDHDNIHTGVEKLNSGHVGLVVLVNRYDGVDLPGDSARILVLDGIPAAQSTKEKIENNLLRMSGDYLQKQVSRIEQGIGRGTRSNDDYCVVFLMGSKLTHFMYLQDAKNRFSPATLAQLELAEKLAEQLKDKPLKDLIPVMDLCLKRDSQWVAASRSAVSGIEPAKKAQFTSWQLTLSKALNLTALGQYQKAVTLIHSQVQVTKDETLKGFLMQYQAEIQNFYDSSASQQTLLTAIQYNRNVLRPMTGINYSKINSPKNEQATAAVEFYKSRFLEANNCIIEIGLVIDDLKFEEDTSNEFESAIDFIGRFLGFNSQRPDNDVGVGPDVLWAAGDLSYFIIECKNGVKIENDVSKSQLEQLQSSQSWFEASYDRTCSKTLIMIHPNRKLEGSAFPAAGMRVIDSDHLIELKKSLRAYVTDLCHDGGLYEVKRVKDRIQHYGFSPSQFLERYTTEFKR